MSIANCPKCNKLFQRTTTPICPTCHQASLSNVSAVYRFICDHPNQTMDAIAKQCNLPIKELEAMLFAGKLGTAAQHIIFHCQSCNRTIPALKRKGHFCAECAGKLDIKTTTPEREASSEKSATRALNRDSQESKTRAVSSTPIESFNEPVAPSLCPPEPPASKQQESVSSLPDSYGFKRGSDSKS